MGLLILIGGPTAVGKTSVSLDLAKVWDTEIISADSRQIYREMSIGTAKPEKEVLNSVRHHFIDEKSLVDQFTAADFEREAMNRLRSVFEYHNICIVTGGTGLYFKALTEGFDDIPRVPAEVINTLNAKLEVKGLDALVVELQSRDPEYAAIADLHNPHRVMRALSVIRFTDKPFSSFLHGIPKKRPFDTLQFVLVDDRESLYERINARVDQMIETGLVDEVKGLIEYRNHRAMQTVGYSELFRYFDGEFGLDRAIELIKRNSRRYAKRQLTWFRNQGNWNQVRVDSEDPVDYIKLFTDRFLSFSE